MTVTQIITVRRVHQDINNNRKLQRFRYFTIKLHKLHLM